MKHFSQSIRWIIALSIVCTSVPAFAGLYLELSALPGYTSKNDSNGNYLGGDINAGSDLTPLTGFSYDLRTTLGWSFNNRFLIGFNYNYANSPLKKSANNTAPTGGDSVDKYTKSTEYGASIGYFMGNFRIIGSYLFSGTMDYKDFEVSNAGATTLDITTHNKGGTGIQVIAGYDFPIGKNIKIGPALTYRKMTYTSQSQTYVGSTNTYGDTPFAVKASYSSVAPMISLSAVW